MRCNVLGINNCFNCWMAESMQSEFLIPEETREIGCWVNVNHRSIEMSLAEGDTINAALLRQLKTYENHPVGDPLYPEVYWLIATIRQFYPEHVDTLEKMLLLV